MALFETKFKMAEHLENNVEAIKHYVQNNYSYQQISNIFKQNFPDVTRGFSEGNIRLFCSTHGIKRMDNVQVDAIIQQSVLEVM